MAKMEAMLCRYKKNTVRVHPSESGIEKTVAKRAAEEFIKKAEIKKKKQAKSA